MIRQRLRHFERIWALDCEYVHDDGEVPEPVCIAAVDILTNERAALWHRDMPSVCPFDTGPNTLFVLFAGSGDIGCFLELGWTVPERIVDLHYEVKQRVYDSALERKASLIQACHMWEDIKQHLVAQVEAKHGYEVYVGTRFSEVKFAEYLQRESIPWPLTESGEHMNLQDATFRKQAEVYPQIRPLRELRHVMSGMRLSDYCIGKDGRNRVHLAPFCSVTGRNQPSNSKFIFGSARWSRSFIQPPPGMALAYCDWSAQEIAVSAAVSGDKRMWESYASGDPYLDFAKQIDLVPPSATKKTHKPERDLCKAIVLGTNYGRGAYSIAQATKMPLSEARELLQRHKEIYRVYWRFIENFQDAACLGLPVRTPYDWVRQAKPGGESLNRRSFQNWPAQATAAEMMRLAACALTERGIRVCCPVHDAFLVEARLNEIEDTVAQVCRTMEDTSEDVLGDRKVVRVDADITRHPDTYRDENAGDFYEQVMRLATELEAEQHGIPGDVPSVGHPRRKQT